VCVCNKKLGKRRIKIRRKNLGVWRKKIFDAKERGEKKCPESSIE
jgi:hypothetical protein